MEQNVAKSSAWAKRAQAGDKITWVPSRGAWALLVNGRIEKYNVAIDRGRMAGVKLDPSTSPSEASLLLLLSTKHTEW